MYVFVYKEKQRDCYICIVYRSICEKFNVGKATALSSVRRVTEALVNLALIFITWPKNDRVQQVLQGFRNVSKFPNVIGAIDGTHINIKAPKTDPECYVNRKGHHSIQLQVIYATLINSFVSNM